MPVNQVRAFLLAACLLAAFPGPKWRPVTIPAQNSPRDVVLELDPAQSKIDWTLSATFHTVHGTFACSKGNIHYDPGTGSVGGEIIADARSGQSGDSGRDSNMHQKVLQSEKYPAIAFRPDRVDGKVALRGDSNVQVHGFFDIHGDKRELSVPAAINFSGQRWTLKSEFDIPYVQWGMKNPSTFFLHVGESVKVEIELAGSATVPR